jgi:hypothetical protein
MCLTATPATHKAVGSSFPSSRCAAISGSWHNWIRTPEGCASEIEEASRSQNCPRKKKRGESDHPEGDIG